jgi:hypothetical protein
MAINAISGMADIYSQMADNLKLSMLKEKMAILFYGFNNDMGGGNNVAGSGGLFGDALFGTQNAIDSTYTTELNPGGTILTAANAEEKFTQEIVANMIKGFEERCHLQPNGCDPVCYSSCLTLVV